MSILALVRIFRSSESPIRSIFRRETVMKKHVLTYLLSLAVLCAMLLSACGGASGGGNQGGGNTNAIDYSGTITVWHGWQGDYLTAKKAIFDAYTKLHPNVKFQLVHQDDVVPKSITALKSGNGPDIIDFVDDHPGNVVLSNSVVHLDQYLSKEYVYSTFS